MLELFERPHQHKGEMGKQSREKRGRKNKNHSTLDQHRRSGKELTPPFMQIPGLAPVSWLDDRLPEMLWAALLIAGLGRERALGAFRAVANQAGKLAERDIHGDATLSGIAALPDDARDQVLAIFHTHQDALGALRPLLLLEDLPGRDAWERVIGDTPAAHDWDALASAVLIVLDHQSQEATDCRWARLIFTLLGGQLHIPREMALEFFNYPDVELRKVRPSVRALEGVLSSVPGGATSDWPLRFWDQCRRDTPCRPLDIARSSRPHTIGTDLRQISAVRRALVEHAALTRITTTVDARHETIFGIAAYTLSLLEDLVRLGNATSVLGRTGLRTILEAYLTLNYLIHRDVEDLWLAYRNYGSGQAKLAFLKLDELNGDAPTAIDAKTLESLASEDRWLEFVSINLGNWEKSNLRQMSEAANAKNYYDQFYDWTSAFVHANWAAVRNSEYDVCANPLHRLHRILRSSTRQLEDVVPDSCRLTDLALILLDRAYPRFDARVTLGE